MRSVVLTLALLAPVSAFAVEPLPVREMVYLRPMLDVVCAGGVAGACSGGNGLPPTALGAGATVPAGTGATPLTVGGVLCKGNPTGADATTEGLTEEIVGTVCSLAANSIAAGANIEIQMTGVTAATANSKVIRVRIGAAGGCLTGAVVFTSSAQSWNNFYFWSEGIDLWRTSATTYASYGLVRAGAKGGAASAGAAGLWNDDTETADWATALDICITFQTNAVAGDATLTSYIVTVDQ